MNILRKLLTGLMNSIIVYVMIMLPTVMNFNVGNQGMTYAQEQFSEDEACVDSDGEQVEGYYQKGCAFKDGQIDMQDWRGDWEGAEIINYLLILVMSMAFVSSIAFSPYKGYLKDCPANQAAKYTIPLVAAGGAAHLVEELLITSLYKSAAEEASDKYIEASKTVANQKSQLEAFDKLIELYERMKTFQITRTTIHSILEALYIGATTAEVVNMATCSTSCNVPRTTLGTSAKTMVGTIKASAATLTGTVNACAAIPGGGSATAACGTLTAALQKDPVTIDMQVVKMEADAAKKVVDETKDNAKNNAELPEATDCSLSAFPEVCLADTPVKKQTENATEEATEQTESTAKTVEQTANEVKLNAMPGELNGLLAGCSAAALADCSKANIAASLCATPVGTCIGTATGQLTALNGQITAFQALMKTPVPCCGGVVAEANELAQLRDGLPAKSQMATMIDTQYKAALAANLFEPSNYIEVAKVDLHNNTESIIEDLTYGLMMNYYVQKKMKHSPNNPSKNLAEYVKYHKRTLRLLKAGPKELLKRPLSAQEIEVALIKDLKLEDNKQTKEMSNLLAQITSEVFIAPAQAFSLSDTTTKMLIAGGVIVIAVLVRKTLQTWFLTKPLTRSLSYGFMAVLTAGQLIVDGLTLAKIKDNLKVVKAERKRFMDATAIDTGLESDDEISDTDVSRLDEGSRSSSPVFLDGQGAIDCSAPKNASSSTSKAEIRKGQTTSSVCSINESIPVVDPNFTGRGSALESSGINMAPLASLMPGITAMKGGLSPTDSSIQDGTLAGTASSAKNILKDLFNKASKKYDAINSEDSKGNKRKGFIPIGVRIGNMAGGRGTISGGVNASSLTSATSNNPLAKDDSEQVKKNNVVSSYTPSATPAIPTASTQGLDFGFGDDAKKDDGIPRHGLREGEDEKQLGKFEIDHNDISNKKGVSIFKLLSNRYIVQYPNLLDKVASRKQDLPVAKEIKKPVTKKGKLKNLLDKSEK